MYCVVWSSALHGGDTEQFLFFQMFPLQPTLGVASLLQHVPNAHTHIPPCSGSVSVGGALGSQPFAWHALTGGVRIGREESDPRAVNTWPLWWRGGYRSTTPSPLALNQSLKSGSFPAAMWVWEREGKHLFAFWRLIYSQLVSSWNKSLLAVLYN